MRIVVVTPTYNERDNIERLIDRLLANGPQYSVLVVDDASPDGTGELVERLSRDNDRVRVLRRPAKEGLGRAYAAGFHAVLSTPVDYVVQMDADLSHDPAFVPMLVHIADQTQSDLVLGSRYIPGARIENWPRRREVLSRLGNLYARLVLGRNISDYTTGFVAFRAEALRQLPYLQFDAKGFAFLLELKYACLARNFRIAEVPITFVERQRGKSKLHTGIIFEALRTVWTVRRRARLLIETPPEPVLRPGALVGLGAHDRADDQ